MFLFVASSLHFPETINNRVFEGEVVCFVSFNIANFFQLSFFVCLVLCLAFMLAALMSLTKILFGSSVLKARIWQLWVFLLDKMF